MYTMKQVLKIFPIFLLPLKSISDTLLMALIIFECSRAAEMGLNRNSQQGLLGRFTTSTLLEREDGVFIKTKVGIEQTGKQ